MIDLDAIKARLAAVHAAGISVINTRLADHGIRVLVSMRDWSGNNRYDADTAVITLVGNAPADIGALIAEVERLQSYAADCEQHATFAAEKAAALERAAVVAWLREQANSTNVAVLCARDSDTAHAIERGEHRREEAE